MNHLTVIAHGEPNSFARRVQVDPTIAVELVQKVREWVESYESDEPGTGTRFVAACKDLRLHFKTMKTLHGI